MAPKAFFFLTTLIASAMVCQAQLFPKTTELDSILLGTQNVGPPDSAAAGFASLEVTKWLGSFRKVTFTFYIQGLTPPLPPLYQHIHKGAAGTNGPVVFVFPGTWANVSVAVNTITLTGTVYNKTLLQVFGDILAAPQNFYVNVHTPSFPAGAVRGQLF